MIRYSLHENNFTPEKGDYVAIVPSRGTLNLAGVIERVTERVTTLPREDAIAIITTYYNYYNMVARLLLEGYNIVILNQL